ncbi:MAG: squalene/phytoene synthase family protein [Rickettsiales bacterium]|nr:squalene/phytoene synthase family protein [Rickettsiales bacterium]
MNALGIRRYCDYNAAMHRFEPEIEIELQQLVRERDYERYLNILVAGGEHSPAIMALLAFHCEIAPVAEIVQEPHVGMIRLKWWHEALDEIEGGKAVRQHHAVQALKQVIDAYELPIALFRQMIDARLNDLEWKQGSPSRDAFFAYLDGTVGALYDLMAHVLMTQSSKDIRSVLSDHARAYGVIGLLRALPYHIESQMIRWPITSLQQHGINPAAIEQGEEVMRVQAFVKEWVEYADALLAQPLPKELKFFSTLQAIPHYYIRHFNTHEYQLNQMPLRPSALAWRLWWRHLTA